MKTQNAILTIFISCLFLSGCSNIKECPSPKVKSSCYNKTKDGNETSVDCGGDCENICSGTTKRVVIQSPNDIKDAYLSSLVPSTPKSRTKQNLVIAWTTLGDLTIVRSIISFNYSAIPVNTSIKKAEITLYADTSINAYGNVNQTGHSKHTGTNNWYIKRITNAWDTTTACWNNQPSVDNASAILLPESNSRSQAYTIDVTDFVKTQISTNSNYGFLLQLKDETTFRGIIFYSSESTFPNLRPKLVIDYNN